MKRVELTTSIPKTSRELAIGYDRQQGKPFARLRKE